MAFTSLTNFEYEGHENDWKRKSCEYAGTCLEKFVISDLNFWRILAI